MYHEDDSFMLLDNGGLESALQNLKGIRKFYILSARNATLRWDLFPHRSDTACHGQLHAWHPIPVSL